MDSVQTNFDAVREIFGSIDKTQPIVEQKGTCQFHCSQAFDHHTK